MAHLVTGYAGYEHIQSEDDGAYNAAFFGSGQYVMESGNQFEGSILDNNTVRILDGDGMMYGRHFRIKPNTYEDLTIATGTAGMNRVDLICMTYEKDSTSQTETAYLQVIRGIETEGTAEIPAYTDGNILEGATKNQMPLYKVTIEGVVLMDIEPLFVTIPTYKTLAEEAKQEFKKACESHLDSLTVLDTAEEIEANTLANQLAGALGVKELVNAMRLACYPVGSIYMSAKATNPGEIFGGTWEAWGSGRVPVGVNASDANFNSVEKTGGASTVALTTEQLPKHNHSLSSHTHTIPALTGSATGGGITNGITGGSHAHEVREANDHNIGAFNNGTWSSGGGCFGRTGDAPANRLIATASTHTHTLPNHTHTVTTVASTTSTPSASHTGNQGSGSAHSNLQPYITCYMWKRTA